MGHTYAHAGVYRVSFLAATIPCNIAMVDGTPVPPTIGGTGIHVCIAVGPGAVAPPYEC